MNGLLVRDKRSAGQAPYFITAEALSNLFIKKVSDVCAESAKIFN